MIDLHMHTNFSDGELSPEELIDLAIGKGLKAIGITDHDTVAGIPKALAYVQDKEIEVVPGIEISCVDPEKGLVEIHVLGLHLDYNNPLLVDFSNMVVKARIEQKKKMISKLQNFGYEITFDEVNELVGESFGRPHIARVLMKKYPEEFPDSRTVFDKYLGNKKLAYVSREGYPTIKEAIELIKKCGGISILAHPGVYASLKDAEFLLDHFIRLGGEGLETYYAYDLICALSKKESDYRNKFFKEYAKKNNLIQSGGSDFHGKSRNTVQPGQVLIGDEILVKMKRHLGK